jgi:transcriptional regulator with XRE-family HTH domain
MTLEQAIAEAFETARVCEELLTMRSRAEGTGLSPNERGDQQQGRPAAAGDASLVDGPRGAMVPPPLDPAQPPRTARAAFGALLRQYRLAAGLSQERLAERAGLSVAGLSALENGRRQAPYRHTVALLAHALGLSPDEAAALEATVVRTREPAPAPDSAPRALDRKAPPAGIELAAARVGSLPVEATALGDAAALRVSVTEREAMEGAIRDATGILGARVAGEVWAAGQALTLEEAITEALGGEG